LRVVHDPDYVDFFVYFEEKFEDERKKVTHIGVHKCTKRDYDKIYKPHPHQELILARLKE